MERITDELLRVSFFRSIPAQEVQRSAPLWSRVELRDGQALWTENGLAMELGVVTLGGLVVIGNGAHLGEVRTGELTGEAAAFFRGETRSATVQARGDAEVLTLPVKGLVRLRREESAVYDALLRQALITLVQRIRTTDLRIAKLSPGGREAPSRRDPSLLVRMWRSLRPGGPSGPCPPLEPLLRRSAVLRSADPAVFAALTPIFRPQPVEEGEILFLEGEQGSAAFLIAQGQVDVLRHVRGDRAEHLATLSAGDLFGANTLVSEGRRTASCVAAAPGWVYRVEAEDFHRLTGRVGRLWRELILAALSAQIRSANAALNKLIENASEPELRQASSFLEGLDLGRGHLAGLSREEQGE